MNKITVEYYGRDESDYFKFCVVVRQGDKKVFEK